MRSGELQLTSYAIDGIHPRLPQANNVPEIPGALMMKSFLVFACCLFFAGCQGVDSLLTGRITYTDAPFFAGLEEQADALDGITAGSPLKPIRERLQNHGFICLDRQDDSGAFLECSA